MFRRIPLAAAALATLLSAGAALANPPLKDVAAISEGLIVTAIAYEIGERCDSINARTLRGIAYLNSLVSHARSLGYSDAEIDAYRNDRDEKRRLEAVARQRLAGMGAVDGQWESYCTVGRQEIAADSAIGRLLR